MSKNEVLWRGDLVRDQSEEWNERECCEVEVTISSLEKSKNNESTFNWGPDTSAVKLTRYPKYALKTTDEDGKKVNLNKYLKNSQVLSVTWEEREDTNLVSYLGHGQDRSIGYLKPAREDLTPVVLVVTVVEDELKLVGFCVDNPLDNNKQQDKVNIFQHFHSLLMSGTRQRKSQAEDRDMQILENNDCRNAEETNIAQCVFPLKSECKEDDEYQVDESLTYDRDIFKREISDQGMDNQISREEKIGENQVVLQYEYNLCNNQTAKKTLFLSAPEVKTRRNKI